MTRIHRKFTNAANGKTTGRVNVAISSSGFASIDRNINCGAINSALSVPPVQGLLLPISKIAFNGYDIKPLPPVEEKANEVKIAEAQKGLLLEDKVVESRKQIRAAFFDTLGYRHAIYNYSMVTADQWTIPDVFKHLQPLSFEVAPDNARNSDQYFSDPLLKGIVTDNNDDSIHYYQSQSRTGKPIEIDAEQILHIRDETPGDLSYIASIIPTIRQWSFARSQAVMKYLQRVAAPNAVGIIDFNYVTAMAGEDAYQGTKTMGIPSEVWSYLDKVIKAQSTDTAFLMPPGTKLDYPALSARPPIEIDQYLIREITSHLIPTNILDTLGSAISKSSAPALELFQLIVNGWREICARPFEEFYSNILEINGFAGWTVEFQWWPIVPEDKAAKHREALDGAMNRLISPNEYRAMHDNLPALDEAGLAQMANEYNSLGGGMI